MRTGHNTILMFKIILLLAVVSLVGLVSAGCTGTTTVPRGWSGATIADGTLFVGSMNGRLVAVNISDGSRLWAEPLKAAEQAGGSFLSGCTPVSTSIAIYGSPAVDDDLVYVGGYNGKIYTISSITRLSKDKYLRKDEKSAPQPIIGSPIVAQGKVYVGSADGWVYALDTVSLVEQWKFETGDKIWSTPAVADGALFVGSFDNKLYALNTADGSKKWEFATQGAIVSAPVVDNNTVYIGSFDRYLYALDATSGSLKWKFMAGNWFWAKPVIHNGTIYAANLDGKVYALDTGSGDKLAEFDLGGPISSAPVLVGDSIVVATESGVVYTLGTADNQQRRLINLEEKIYASLAASQGIVYIHSVKDVLYAVDARSGAVREFNIN